MNLGLIEIQNFFIKVASYRSHTIAFQLFRAENKWSFTMFQLFSKHRKPNGMTISATTERMIKTLCHVIHCMLPLNWRHKSFPVYVVQNSMLYLNQCPVYFWSLYRQVMIFFRGMTEINCFFKNKKLLDTTSVRLLKDAIRKDMESWFGMTLGDHINQHMCHGGTLSILRCQNEIVPLYIAIYAPAIGDAFTILPDFTEAVWQWITWEAVCSFYHLYNIKRLRRKIMKEAYLN